MVEDENVRMKNKGDATKRSGGREKTRHGKERKEKTTGGRMRVTDPQFTPLSQLARSFSTQKA